MNSSAVPPSPAPLAGFPVATAPPTQEETQRLDFGWVIAGPMDAADLSVVHDTRLAVLERLRTLFPHFDWRMPLVHRREMPLEQTREPTELLAAGLVERAVYCWDFGFVVSDTDLRTYDKPFAFGAPSRPLFLAALSTVRIHPPQGTDSDPKQVHEINVHRLTALALHLFGHLNDLSHDEDPANYMMDFKSERDLDRLEEFSATQIAALDASLSEVADVRLEETGFYTGRHVLFYLKAALHRKREILSSVLRIQPWLFPVRFGRFTAASASTLLIMTFTAESWEMGMSQPPALALAISVITLLAMSIYLIHQQKLLLPVREVRLSEQRVVRNVSTVAAVVLGMVTMYSLLLGIAYSSARLLSSPDLVASWAPTLEGGATQIHYLVFAAMVASLGLVIGGLGASFEQRSYFRHALLVDEET